MLSHPFIPHLYINKYLMWFTKKQMLMFIWEARHIMKKEEKWKMDFVAPKSVGDVSRIVKIAKNFDVPLSVRSGGHSFLCQSIKPGKSQHTE